MILNLFVDFLITFFVGVSLLLVLVILMQRSKQDGLGAAFGGGLTETVFGAQTSNILVRITAWLIGMFFVLAITLAYFYGHGRKSAIEEKLHPALAPVPAATAPADASAAPASIPTPAAPATPAPAPQAQH